VLGPAKAEKKKSPGERVAQREGVTGLWSLVVYLVVCMAESPKEKRSASMRVIRGGVPQGVGSAEA